MRYLLKMWRNGRGGKWDCRIRWLDEGDCINIRLELEDCERKHNLYPTSEIEADLIWSLFKLEAPEGKQGVPIISKILSILENKNA